MTRQTWRAVLLAAVGAATGVAGCSGAGLGAEGQSPTTTPTAPEFERVTATPTCAWENVSHMLVVEPKGFTIHATDESNAEEILDSVPAGYSFEPSLSRVRSLTVDGNTTYAVEIWDASLARKVERPAELVPDDTEFRSARRSGTSRYPPGDRHARNCILDRDLTLGPLRFPMSIAFGPPSSASRRAVS